MKNERETVVRSVDDDVTDEYRNSAWSHDRVCKMSTDAIVMQLLDHGIYLRQAPFLAMCQARSSGWAVGQDLIKASSNKELSTDDKDFVVSAACILWERDSPHRPSFEMLQLWLHQGYRAYMNGRPKSAIRRWQKVWRGIYDHHLLPGITDIDRFNETFNSLYTLSNWICEFSFALMGVAVKDDETAACSLQFFDEFVLAFPCSSPLKTLLSSRVEILWLLGRQQEAEQSAADLLVRYPENPFCTMALAKALALGRTLNRQKPDFDEALRLMELAMTQNVGENYRQVIQETIGQFREGRGIMNKELDSGYSFDENVGSLANTRFSPYDTSKLLETFKAEGPAEKERVVWYPSRVRAMSTKTIIDRLQTLGFSVNAESFLDACSHYLSAWSLGEAWVDIQDQAALPSGAKDFMCLAGCILWERLLPGRPSLEMYSDRLREGYDAQEVGEETEAIAIWWRVWQNFLKHDLAGGFREIALLNARYPARQTWKEWVFDFSVCLLEVAGECRQTAQRALAFHTQFIDAFPTSQDAVFYRPMLCECLWKLGRQEEAEHHGRQCLKEYPAEINGYTKLAYTLLSGRIANGEQPVWAEALDLLRRGAALCKDAEEKADLLNCIVSIEAARDKSEATV